MGLIDINNFEGGGQPNKISWTTLAGVIVGWMLARLSDLFIRYRKMVKTGSRFRQQIVKSKLGYDKQLDSLNNLIEKLKNNEFDSLTLHLLQQFNTIKSLDKSLVFDYFESWWYRLWHKKVDEKPEFYVDTAYGIIENMALEMKRLESMFKDFQSKRIAAFSSYAKEIQDIKKEVDTVLEITTEETFANDEVLNIFGRLYVSNFIPDGIRMKSIDEKLFQDLLINFHSALSVTLPVNQDNPLYRKIKDFNHSSGWIINTFNHNRDQMIGSLELIENSMRESYNTLYGVTYQNRPKKE